MDTEKILSQMTLRQKLSQMTMLVQCYEEDCFHPEQGRREFIRKYAKEHFDIDEYDMSTTGSAILIDGAETAIAIQKRHLEHDPNGIPLLFMYDVIHGFRTVFPIPLALGCTFSPEGVERMARISAREAAAAGVKLAFSPMLDLVRDARWGRVMESTGEDPYLNSRMAEAFVRGYQGDDPAAKDAIGACVKHFAGYGAPDAGREYNTVELSEYTFRNMYLPAYHAAVDAGAVSVMSAFNTVDGIPSSGNRRLLHDILREEWGFEGFVISDWGSAKELYRHGFTEDDAGSCEAAVNATLDIEMMSTLFLNHGEELVRQGRIGEEQIDDAVRHILHTKEKLGLFDDPFGGADPALEKEISLCDAHRAEARRLASMSCVLLKNENDILPLRKEEKTAFIGPYATTDRLNSRWGSRGKREETVTLAKGVSDKTGHCVFVTGCDFSDPALPELQAAVSAAENADKVVLCVGESEQMCGEARSRAFLTLPEAQIRLCEAVLAVGKPTVLLLFGGRPQEIRQFCERCDGIMAAWLPGTEGGNGVADVLYGDFLPEGRLSMSFPYTVGQCPVYYNQLNTGRPYSPEADSMEDNECTSRFIDIPQGPLYPFGYGLGYSETVFLDLSLSDEIMREEETVTVKVRNVGKNPMTEVVQLYVRDEVGAYCRPVKELKGFRKVNLCPGETKEVSFVLTKKDLTYWHGEGGTFAEPGRFTVYVGKNAADDTLSTGFTLINDKTNDKEEK